MPTRSRKSKAAAKARAEAREQAAELWRSQKRTLDQASATVRDASQRLAAFASNEVAPRARDAWQQARPIFERGVAATRETANRAQEKLVKDVVPAVAGAVGTALTIVELARSEVVRDAIRNSAASGKKALASTGKAVAKESRKVAKAGRKALAPAKSGGAGKVLLLSFGLVLLGTATYAAWRTFRAEEDLWVPEGDAPATGTDPGNSEV